MKVPDPAAGGGPTSGAALRLLIVEDSEADAALVLRELRRAGYVVAPRRVEDAAGLAAALGDPWDVITCDWVLPGFGAPQALRMIAEAGVDVPTIIVSGEVGEDYAVTAMKSGAQDVVSKQRLARLAPAVARELREAAGRRARRRAEAALAAERELLATLIGNVPDPVWFKDAGGVYRACNAAFERLMGQPRAAILGRTDYELVGDRDLAEFFRQRDQLAIVNREPTANEEWVRDAAHGQRVLLHTVKTPLFDGGGRLHGVLGIARDITDLHERAALQEQLETIAAAAPGVIFTLRRRADGRLSIPYASDALSPLFGVRPEDVRDDAGGLLARLPADDRTRVTQSLEASAATLHPWREEFRVSPPGGEVRWAEGHALPQLQADGDVLWHGILADVSDRHLADESLRASERRFRALFENMLNGYALFHLERRDGRPHDLRYLEVNAAFGRLTGLRDVVGRRVSQVIPTALDENRAALEAAARVVANDRPERHEAYFPSLDRFLDISFYPVGGDCFVAVFDDVSARRRAAAEIGQLNAALEARVAERTAALDAANRELEAFTFSVSHDLRAPLRTIEGFSQALGDELGGRLPAAAQRSLTAIRAGAARMGELIDALLELAHLGRVAVQRRRVDMVALARESLAELAAQRAGRPLLATINDLPACEGDPRLLKQVWSNLLANAIKYTAGRVPAEVEVSATHQAGEVVYSVRDNGAGFDMAGAPRLFQIFQRLHGEHEFPGSGIGLAVVQQIIQRHGGRVWGEGEVGRGATFSFTVGALAGGRRAADAVPAR